MRQCRCCGGHHAGTQVSIPQRSRAEQGKIDQVRLGQVRGVISSCSEREVRAEVRSLSDCLVQQPRSGDQRGLSQQGSGHHPEESGATGSQGQGKYPGKDVRSRDDRVGRTEPGPDDAPEGFL